MRILLVEDDAPLAHGLKASLSRETYIVDWVDNGRQAISSIKTEQYEAVILDLGLPDIDGLTVLKKIKQFNKLLPVLILTARDSIENKVEGLDFGADDYIAKPFNIAELLARLRVIERRHSSSQSLLIEIQEVALDTKAHLVNVYGSAIEISKKEYLILKSLMENAGRVQSKNQLESKMYEWGEEVSSNAIEVHMHNLRKKLPKDFIKTIRGVGYTVSKH